MNSHCRKGVFLLFLLSCCLQGLGQTKSLAYYYHGATKFHPSGDIDGAIQLLDSGITYFSEVDAESKSFLEYIKSSTILTFIGSDSCLRYINRILSEYESGKRTHPTYKGVFLSMKAAAISQKGYRREALQLIKEALSNFAFEDTTLTIYNRDVYIGRSYISIGSLYEGFSELDSSLAYYQKALFYIDTSNFRHTSLLTYVADIYARMGKCGQSNAVIERAERAISTIGKGYEIERVFFYEGLARATYGCQDWEQTIAYTDSVDKYVGLINNIQLKIGANSCYMLAAEASLRLENVIQAHKMCRKSVLINKSQLIFKASLLNADKRIDLLNDGSWSLDESISTLVLLDNSIPDFNKQTFEYTLFLKNYAFHTYELLQQRISDSKDAGVKELYANWLKRRENYYGAIRFDSSTSDTALRSLKNTMLSMEDELYLKTGLTSTAEDFSEKHLGKIQGALDDTELAIEFVRFKDVLTQDFTYGAFVIEPKDEAPMFLSICTEEALGALLQREPLESELKYIRRVYRDNSLYNLLWLRIREDYPDATRIYTSLSGQLHSINHEALKKHKDQCLGDEIDLILVNSTKDIAQVKRSSEGLTNAQSLIYGGIRYDFDGVMQDTVGGQRTIYDEFRGQIQGNWKYLSNTQKEVEDIAKTLSKAEGQTTLYDGIEATETSFKQAISHNPPDIIHIATHGLYIKPNEQKDFSLASYSYTHSGLVMAGANTCFDHQTSYTNFGDGILTAPEIAMYDLSNTKLVVLSACESGLGSSSQLGTSYGLQKAFKIAGAHKVVYSLWKVSDETTKEFMTTFYGQLATGLQVVEAFHNTQQVMMDKYDVYDWAAFQLIH